MSGRWFRVYGELVNDPAAQMMRPAAFKKAVMAALRGEDSPLSRFFKADRGRPTGPEWAALRSEIFARDDYSCRYCGDRGGRLECDHIVPVSRGGPTNRDNLATACFACNRSKRDKLVSEWLE